MLTHDSLFQFITVSYVSPFSTHKSIRSDFSVKTRDLVGDPGELFNRHVPFGGLSDFVDWKLEECYVGSEPRNGEIILRHIGTLSDLPETTILPSSFPDIDGYKTSPFKHR